MPELPEVETIRRQLAPAVTGRRIERLEIADPRWCAPAPPAMVEAAAGGRRIAALERRGKYLVWRLDGAPSLVTHLRMTGALLYDGAPARPRVTWHLDDGHRVALSDPRRFGTGELVADLDAYFAARLGVEPLGPDFTTAYLRALARGRRVPVKAFLLDQRRIAGVGNIYADEALFRARIHPLRATGRLRPRQLAALRDAVVAVLEEGIDARGATIDDFRHADGAYGSFQDRFLVHRRAGEPCPVCGTRVRKIVAAGRGTYVCERCQPRPRPATRPAAR